MVELIERFLSSEEEWEKANDVPILAKKQKMSIEVEVDVHPSLKQTEVEQAVLEFLEMQLIIPGYIYYKKGEEGDFENELEILDIVPVSVSTIGFRVPNNELDALYVTEDLEES